MTVRNGHLICCFLWLTSATLLGQVTNSTVLSGRAVYVAYGELIGRSVLGPGTWKVRPPNIVITNLPPETNAAIALIESEMSRAGLEIVQDGSKFVRIHPRGWRGTEIERYLEKLKISEKRSATETVPAGMINLMGVGFNQIRSTYSQMRNRTVIHPSVINYGMSYFKNQTAINVDEAEYVYKVLLALNGIAVVDDGDKFVWAVPFEEMNGVELGAAKLDKSSKLIDLGRIPVFNRFPPPAKPNTANESVTQLVKRVAADLYEKLTKTGPPQLPATVESMVAFYGKLIDKEVAPSKRIVQLAYFQAQTALTKAELAYALENTLKLQNIVIVHTDENTIAGMTSYEAAELKAKSATNSVAPLRKDQ